jgi:hypothetical protein
MIVKRRDLLQIGDKMRRRGGDIAEAATSACERARDMLWHCRDGTVSKPKVYDWTRIEWEIAVTMSQQETASYASTQVGSLSEEGIHEAGDRSSAT